MLPHDTRAAILDLLGEYVYAVDQDRLEDWVELFTQDCLYKIVPKENLAAGLPAALLLLEGKDMLRDRVAYLRKAAVYNLHWDRHLISTVCIKEDQPGSYRSVTNFACYQSDLEGRSTLFCVGYYEDLIVTDAGQLRFKERLVVIETSSVQTLLPTPL
jgi:anthranilate 1,2-dioxygenase small subunit